MLDALDKMKKAIANAVASKISFDPESVCKKFKYKILRTVKEDGLTIVVGNEGKVFDGIIIANNKANGEKVLILIKPDAEEQFKLILNHSTDSILESYVEAVNKEIKVVNGVNISNNLKNKSMKISLLVEKIKEVLKDEQH